MGTNFTSKEWNVKTSYLDKMKWACEVYLSYKKYKEDLKYKKVQRKSDDTLIYANQNTIENFEDDIVFKLEAGLKNQLELAFDEDLSEVKIHTGKYADMIAKSNNAKAVTIGYDIYFVAGAYSLDSESGIALLTHEIQHVVQNKKNKRFVFLEDMAEGEEEAEKAESAMNRMNLHSIKNPVMKAENKEPINDFEYNNDIYKETLDSDLINKESLSDFSSKEREEFYETVIMNKKYMLTKFEKEEIKRIAKNNFLNYIRDKRSEMTEEEYGKYMIKVSKWMKKV